MGVELTRAGLLRPALSTQLQQHLQDGVNQFQNGCDQFYYT